jgi:hypothetical protein
VSNGVTDPAEMTRILSEQIRRQQAEQAQREQPSPWA